MDGRNFDDLIRGLGTGRSRRSVLKGLVAGTALMAVGRTGDALAARPIRYAMCHVDKKGNVREIEVAGNKVEGHLSHGDTFLGTNVDCSACGVGCGAGESCIDFTCVLEECLPGTAPNGSGGCDSCLPGTASNDGLACRLCEVDTYAASYGQLVCDPCPDGTSTNGSTGASSCTPDSGGFICTSADQCQFECPGSVFNDFCYCSTIYESGEPVCYRSGNGCASGAYCDTSGDCPGDQVCLNMNGGCGGCDDFTGGRGICNSIC